MIPEPPDQLLKPVHVQGAILPEGYWLADTERSVVSLAEQKSNTNQDH